MREKKKVGIFDIDGTIFRSSLLIELTDALVQEEIFSSKTRNIYKKAHRSWLDRESSYQRYIDAVVDAFMKNIKGVSYNDFSRVAKKVVAFHKDRNYRYSIDVVKKLKKKNYFLLAISGSPLGIVKEFGRKIGFDKIYGRVLEVNENKKFTGNVLCLNLIENKNKILERALEKENLTLKGSVGMGDTETDISFLRMVEKPICFNPNRNLYNYARKKGWKIVAERKDVIYEI